jgi:hypothetical protein
MGCIAARVGGPFLILPRQPVAIIAEPGDRLAFASMFVQSNALFYPPEPANLALFSQDGRPFAGEVSSKVTLWDAGTEKNEVPGIGANQARASAAVDVGIVISLISTTAQ